MKTRRVALSALALAGFAIGAAVLTLVGEPGEPGGALVFAPSVALVALEFGVVPGLVAAALGTTLYGAAVDWAGGHASAGELLGRLIPFLFIAGVIGWLGSRLRTDAARIERHELARRQARDLNDTIVQALVLTKYSLQRGDVPAATATVEATLDRAREMVDELFGEEEVVAGQLRREEPADLHR